MKGRFWRVGFILAAAMLGLVAAILIAIPLGRLFVIVGSWMSPEGRVSGDTVLILRFLPTVNVILLPWLAGGIVRDTLLERCIRGQLAGACCPECNYNLIGLIAFGESENRMVQCPECGVRIELNVGHITESDIDPTRLTES